VVVEAVSTPIDFAEMVREHQHMVFSLALHFLRDRESAEEVAQDVFLHLHQKLNDLESVDHVKFWLRRVATHRCIDEARRRKLRPNFNLEDQLGRLIAALPERARMMVLLRYQEDMDPAEIAAVAGVPLSTVKSLLHRSIHTLRTKMERRLQKQEARQ
jgi:RNA polymerase sigma-70 factor (ECF subfamily)